MELLTGRKALDDKRSEEDVHLATWFRRMFINKDSFSKAIDETVTINEETISSINKVAELASHCCAREPQQRPDMSHVVNVLVSLGELWKPAERGGGSDNIYGIDYDTPLPQVERIFRGLVETSNVSLTTSFFGDNTQTSMPSRPPELDNTFKSGQGR